MPLTEPVATARRNVRRILGEYPRAFWMLAIVTFIDRLGGSLLYPFFALYITSKFGVGMTQVGVLFGFFSISSIVGGFVGGAAADRLGRKGLIVFSLLATSLSSLAMGLAPTMAAFVVLALVVGLLTDAGGPAYQAMVADLLPEEKRAEGFGVIRVVFNLAVVIGPAIGGLLASRSFLLLFIVDAITSALTAAFAIFFLAETKPAPHPDAPRETVWQTFRGYGQALRDSLFMAFVFACALQVLVYLQMNTSLPVFLRDHHGISPQGYGGILSLNAAMVVLFQFAITRRIRGYPPLIVMAVGTALYALGFAMYGFTATYALFLLAMVIITIGEMLVAPVSQALVAQLAPEDKRARYMATFGLAWIIPGVVGPLLAGLVMDYGDARWVWYAAGLIGAASAAMFLRLQRRVGGSRQPAPAD